MKNQSKSIVVNTFQGKALDKPLSGIAEWQDFESIEEAKNAGKWPNDADILTFVNRTQKANAVSKETQRLTADLLKAYKDSPEYQTDLLCKQLREQHPDWSNEKIADRAAKAFALMNGD